MLRMVKVKKPQQVTFRGGSPTQKAGSESEGKIAGAVCLSVSSLGVCAGGGFHLAACVRSPSPTATGYQRDRNASRGELIPDGGFAWCLVFWERGALLG